MGRDKAKDNNLFNCSQDHELNQVAQHYGNQSSEVKDFLQNQCEIGEIKNLNHCDVYDKIKNEFDLDIPDGVNCDIN